MCWYCSILSSFRGWNFSVKNFFIKYLIILRYCLYRKGRKKSMTLSLCLPVFRIMSLFLVASKGEQWRFCFALSITVNSCILILGWPKSSFIFFCRILQENPNELFGQPNIFDMFLYITIKKIVLTVPSLASESLFKLAPGSFDSDSSKL